jgi:hypothetical protein
VTVFAYGFLLQVPPLHLTVSAGGVASPTSLNEAVSELRPAAFVAVTLKGAVCTLPALLNAYVRRGPEPAAVKPGIDGNE